MIQATQSEWTKKAFYQVESKIIFPWKFEKIQINKIPLRAHHSVLLLQNHFSWWDGFWGSYLTYQYLNKSYHVMVQEDQLVKHRYLRFKGCFSIKKQSREIYESLSYAARLLNDTNNMVLIFPQGRLQSMYTDTIDIEKGTTRLIKSIKGNCQVIYNAVTIDYLESFKPTVTMHLMDCGIAQDINEHTLQNNISTFHKQALKSSIRP